ncbi:porin [Ramlibacter sp. G-1-2-2]|uniref:Porin n=1 Tax=Ramlibacter agri TaxID=2728837 RepID=A0A848GUF1_9BURK|nr:porin [Ramlibacter agri]NML42245.1 porin [Ramlibacter agri]
MKKTWIALGICSALAGPALAQSSVSIYGIVDVGVTKQNGGTTPLSGGNGVTGPGGDKWDVRQAYASRLGFRGTEDLGGGLRAGFNMEMRFMPDTGAMQGTQAFFGRSVVTFGGSAGELIMGRDYLPAFYVAIAADPFSYNGIAQMGQLHTFPGYSAADGTGPVQAVRNDNQISYKSPSMGGFTTQVAYSPNEGSRGTLGRAVGGNVEYRAGALYAGVGFDQTRNNGTGHDPRLLVATMAYDFGGVRPILGYGRGRSALLDDSVDVSLGLNVTAGPGVIHALAARLNPPGDNNTLVKYGLGYEYFLSKRTSLYADVASAKKQALTTTTGFDTGVTLRF